MNIGYVGLGNMGSALASRLLLKFPLNVFDLHTEAIQRLTAKGAIACTSLPELAARCEVVILCLPTSDHVRAALFGENGIANYLAKGALVIDQTSGDPRATRKISAELLERGIDFIDAPVSGGRDGAAAGTIAIMIGGTEAQYERAKQVLNAISSNLFHAGGTGSGHAMKLVNNMLSGAQRILSLEALALAEKNGIDSRKAAEILSAGGARNAFLQTFAKQGIQRADFTLALMHKDLRLACDLGSESRVPLYFGSLAREQYLMAINQFGPEASVQAIAMAVDQASGTDLVKNKQELR